MLRKVRIINVFLDFLKEYVILMDEKVVAAFVTMKYFFLDLKTEKRKKGSAETTVIVGGVRVRRTKGSAERSRMSGASPTRCSTSPVTSTAFARLNSVPELL